MVGITLAAEGQKRTDLRTLSYIVMTLTVGSTQPLQRAAHETLDLREGQPLERLLKECCCLRLQRSAKICKATAVPLFISLYYACFRTRQTLPTLTLLGCLGTISCGEAHLAKSQASQIHGISIKCIKISKASNSSVCLAITCHLHGLSNQHASRDHQSRALLQYPLGLKVH